MCGTHSRTGSSHWENGSSDGGGNRQKNDAMTTAVDWERIAVETARYCTGAYLRKCGTARNLTLSWSLNTSDGL